MLEPVRAKFHKLEQNPVQQTSDSGFLHGPLYPIDAEYLVMNKVDNRMGRFVAPHCTFPSLPVLLFYNGDLISCVHCKSMMYTSHECDPYRMTIVNALEIKSRVSQSVSKEVTEPRPCAGPLPAKKRPPERDSNHYYTQIQDTNPCPGRLARSSSVGQLTVVTKIKEDRLTMKVQFPRPIDRPQAPRQEQDPKGQWVYDDKSWQGGWKFVMMKTRT